MAQIDCIGPMRIAMKIRRDMIGVACDALMKMFQIGDDDLVEQVSVCSSVTDCMQKEYQLFALVH